MNARALLLVVCLSLPPALLLSQSRFADAFYWVPLSSVGNGLSTGTLVLQNAVQPAYEILLFTLAATLGMGAEPLAFLPLGFVVVPLVALAVGGRLSGSRTAGLVLGLYYAFDFSLVQTHYNAFMYTWTRTLFLLFVLQAAAYVETLRPRVLLQLLLLFLALFFFHPTPTFWAIIFIALLGVVASLGRVSRTAWTHTWQVRSLAVVLVILFLGLNQVFYSQVLPRVILFNPNTVPDLFLPKLHALLGSSRETPEPFAVGAAPLTPAAGQLAMARTLLVLAAVALGFWCVRRAGAGSRPGPTPSQPFWLALVAVGVVHVASYALYGHFSLRFVLEIFPLVALAQLERAGRRRWTGGLGAGLVALALLAAGSIAASPLAQRQVAPEEVEPAFAFLATHGAHHTLLTDFSTGSVLSFLLKTQDATGLLLHSYDGARYAALVHGTPNESDFDAVLVNDDLAPWPVDSTGWRLYEPLADHRQAIETNGAFHRVYDGTQTLLLAAQEGRDAPSPRAARAF